MEPAVAERLGGGFGPFVTNQAASAPVARALNNLGIALRDVQRFEEAITAHQDAAAIYRETGDRHREGMALNNLKKAQAAQET